MDDQSLMPEDPPPYSRQANWNPETNTEEGNEKRDTAEGATYGADSNLGSRHDNPRRRGLMSRARGELASFFLNLGHSLGGDSREGTAAYGVSS
jgi:hypothetical protein